MTWDSRITMPDGTLKGTDYAACQTCKHNATCNVAKVAPLVGQLLTSIDVGSDNHMASGSAHLRCNGHESEQIFYKPGVDVYRVEQ